MTRKESLLRASKVLLFALIGIVSIMSFASAQEEWPTMEQNGYYFTMNGETAQIHYNQVGAYWMLANLHTATAQSFAFAKAQGHPLDRTFDSVELEISVHIGGWGITSVTKGLRESGPHKSSNPIDINHHSDKAFDYLIDRS